MYIADHVVSDPLGTGYKLKVHKMFRTRPERLLNALCTFNLCFVSGGWEVWILRIIEMCFERRISYPNWQIKTKIQQPITKLVNQTRWIYSFVNKLIIKTPEQYYGRSKSSCPGDLQNFSEFIKKHPCPGSLF